MIGSFWNLCRACPSMPVDKLHSEYRSTYRWHEYTGPRQEVVRRPPQSNAPAPSGDKINDVQITSTRNQDDEGHNELPKMEPALPRRKKHPDLAYRHHEFLISDNGPLANSFETNNADRARSEERGGSHWRPSRRSKSEGPARGSFLNEDRDRERRRESDPDLENTGRDTGLLRKAISKISTEYRLQFAWPQGHTSRRDAAGASATAPRKSQSMGAIKPAANAIVHRKRIDLENKDASELEPLVNDATATTSHDDGKHQKRELTEYKKKFRPFSQYEYSDGRFTSKRGLVCNKDLEETLVDGTNNTNNDSWYREVVELRKKAGEYKHRGWGSELAPERLTDIYNKQIELWDQVSRRSSLSALSLASTTHRSYTKEEKEEENNKKSSPTKAARNAENSAKLVRDMIRHHLERTTGGSEFDGIILSPTREKLEPTIPRKDDDSRGSQRNSPKKNSPQKMSLQKRNAQRTKNNLRTVRSQSVGPTEMIAEKRSPKRQSRSATVKEKKTSSSASVPRRPRPSSLNTSSASSRSKSSSVPPKSEDNRSAKAKTNKYHSTNESSDLRKGGSGADSEGKTKQNENTEVPTAPNQTETIDLEPVVKSPPEPTRVKSPEQIIMRSPDPVNWTVPLDTGKTFTVTQNVRGEAGARPHSEVKAWTPPEVPPPVAQSAPPELSERAKEQGMSMYGFSSQSMNSGTGQYHYNTNRRVPKYSGKTFNSRNDAAPPSSSVILHEADPVIAGKKNVHPIITSETDPKRHENNPPSKEATEVTSTSGSNRSLASEVLEKARSRFDRFWGRNSKDDDGDN